jgi:NTE family protein
MLFRNLQPDETAAILARLRAAHFVRGTRIMQRGVWHGLLYIIASGQVSVLLQDESDKPSRPSQASETGTLAVARLGAGECFGEMSLITGEPPSATIRAEEDTHLWALPQADFLTLVGSCPSLLRNINTILSLRLARTNQQLLLTHAAERIWLPFLDDAASAIARSLLVHVASALAARSQKRVLLLECCDQQEAVGPRFATHPGQLRPSLAACARDQSLVQAHRTPPLTAGAPGYPALSALTEQAAPAGSDSPRDRQAPVNLLAGLADLAPCYDYILLVTTPHTPPDLLHAVAQVCSRSFALVPAALASTHPLPALPTTPTALFVTHVPEPPTIGQQDRYASLLGAPVTRLLPADLPLLEHCWQQQAPLGEIARDAALTHAVDFLARSIAHQTVGIAFGGGGARGFAHLGVLESLLSHGVPLDYIAACSSGIIAPGMYLLGKSFVESEAIFLHIQRQIVRWHLPRTSLFSNTGLKQLLRSLCGDMRFEDLSTPFAMVAVDLATRAGVVLDRGPLWQASLASVSLPGIFPPVTVGEHLLMDAGMHDPVPLRLVRTMGADILLASELGGQEPPSLQSATPWLAEPALSRNPIRSPHIIDLLLRSYDLAMATIGMHSIREADVVIRPSLHRISLRQFSEGRKFVTSGREAAEQSLPSLRQFLPWIV